MLSYQHGFHAGNFADVHKHAVLVMLLDRFRAAPDPFTVIDLFAGSGLYDLTTAQAEKTGEWKDGIGKLWGTPFPAELASFEKMLKGMNGPSLRRYPGSPAIARALMRADDRLTLNELHRTEFENLKNWAKTSPRIEGHRQDAFIALNMLVPPKIRRGLMLLDPSYEVKDEYERVPRATLAALARWPEGCFIIWYPMLPARRHEAIYELLGDMPCPALSSELLVGDGSGPGMYGSGLVIVNPPEDFDAALGRVAAWWSGVGPAGAVHEMEWIREPA